MKPHIRAILLRFSEKTSWHGVGEIGSSKSICMRVFWSIVVTLSTVILFYQIINLIYDYVAGEPYKTSLIAVKLGDRGAPFPNVTICSFGRVSQLKADRMGVNNSALSYIFAGLPQYYETSSYVLNNTDLSLMLNLNYQRFERLNGPQLVEELVVQLGHECSEKLLTCAWAGVHFDCCSHAKTILNIYGKCQSITPPEGAPWLAGNPPGQNVPGAGNALTMLLNPQIDTSLRPYYNDFLSEGMILLVNDEPKSFWPVDPIALEAGTANYVSLSVEISRTIKPVMIVSARPCQPDPYKLSFIPGKYTVSKCVMNCFISAIVHYCNCLFKMGSFGETLNGNYTYPNCYLQDSLCITKILYGTEKGWPMNAYAEYLSCSNGCSISCSETASFTATISRAKTSQSASHLLLQSRNITLVGNDSSQLIRLDLFYPFIGITYKVTDEATTIVGLVASLGGQLGLWAGLSVISLIQIFFYFLQICAGEKVQKKQEETNNA